MKSGIIRALLIGASVSVTTAGAQTTGHAAPPVANSESVVATGSARVGTPSDSSRSYDAQALRYESRWGSAVIIRGAKGSVLGTAGLFRDLDVSQLVASSPQAAIEARAFRTNNSRGALVGGLGVTTVLVGAILTSNSSNNAGTPVLMVAGAIATAWGVQHLNIGYAALSRALWWYNRDLTR